VTSRATRGFAARRSGRRAEVWAAVWLMVRGYRILGFRLKTPMGEIDIVAKRGKVLAVVEVKSRTELETALEAVSDDQRERLRRAGVQLVLARPALRDCAVRLDLIALAPGRLPLHIADAWKGV
jgi:putative endonuclease